MPNYDDPTPEPTTDDSPLPFDEEDARLAGMSYPKPTAEADIREALEAYRHESPRPRFLNPEVEREVRADETLFVAWCLTHGDYDEEIEPLHRPSWVAEAQAREVRDVADLKKRIAAAQTERA